MSDNILEALEMLPCMGPVKVTSLSGSSREKLGVRSGDILHISYGDCSIQRVIGMMPKRALVLEKKLGAPLIVFGAQEWKFLGLPIPSDTEETKSVTVQVRVAECPIEMP